MGEFVKHELIDGVLVIRLDRPPLNVLSTAVQHELAGVAHLINESKPIRAALLWGGPRAFAAGSDVKEMHAMSVEDLRARPEGLQYGFTQLAELKKPLVAAITGVALGGGLELALTADIRVAAAGSTLGLPETTLGLMPGGGGTQRLARLVGPGRAKALILMARRLTAEEALTIGLVDAVIPADAIYQEALQLATTLATGPTAAYNAVREAVDMGFDLDLEAGLALERRLFETVFATHDKTVGTTHFINKEAGRAPFEGR